MDEIPFNGEKDETTPSLSSLEGGRIRGPHLK
jgi:hypothetical protein